MTAETVTARLREGGDHRLLAGDDGLSVYRVAMQPRDTTPLGSCTASNPGPRALLGAREAYAAWTAHGRSADVVDALQQKTRDELRTMFSLDDATEIALAPSGTDVLYLLDALVHARGQRVHHVVVGASELGGGTVRASSGLTFSTHTPTGAVVAVGQPLDGLAERCSAEAVYLRDALGERLRESTVDALVEERVHAAVAPGTRVVVHLVAHSKTGLRGPSFGLGQRLVEEFGDGVLVLVDAAQGRLAPADMRQALRCGFIVLFTGSKFYCGPPFSGALFLPDAWADDPGPLPGSIHPWFDAASLPGRWTEARASLTQATNPGLMLRWRAAMAEITAYHAIEPRRRAAVYATFAGAVHEVLGSCDILDLELPLPPTHGLTTALGAFPTVYGFRVRDRHGWLDAGRLKTLHRLLDTEGPESHTAHYLGQPVALGPPGEDRRALLRVALGARMVTDLAHEPDAGGRWMRQRMRALRSKLEHLVHTDAVGAVDV